MKRIYIINSIVNIFLGIICFFTVLCININNNINRNAIITAQTTNIKINSILIYIALVFLVVLVNLMTFIFMNKLARKQKYKIRIRLYFLISGVMLLSSFMLIYAILAILG